MKNKKHCENLKSITFVTLLVVSLVFFAVWATITIFNMEKEIFNFHKSGFEIFIIVNILLSLYYLTQKRKCLVYEKNKFTIKRGVFNDHRKLLGDVLEIKFGKLWKVQHIEFHYERINIRLYSFMFSKNDFVEIQKLIE